MCVCVCLCECGGCACVCVCMSCSCVCVFQCTQERAIDGWAGVCESVCVCLCVFVWWVCSPGLHVHLPQILKAASTTRCLPLWRQRSRSLCETRLMRLRSWFTANVRLAECIRKASAWIPRTMTPSPCGTPGHNWSLSTTRQEVSSVLLQESMGPISCEFVMSTKYNIMRVLQ